MRFGDGKFSVLQRGGGHTAARRVRFVLIALMFVSSGLLVLSRINHSVLSGVRLAVAERLNPILDAAMVPFEPIRRAGQRIAEQVDLSEELQRLRGENQRLSGWEWRARQLERRIADLEALAKAVPETRIDFITSRVIGDSSGAFGRTALIDAGARDRVQAGFPVVNADGLVGRVIETANETSRVLLLTDLNSRVPVVVGRGAVRAVLAGNNSPKLQILYLPEDAQLTIGDDVWTSGVGGVYPRGLRIGTVAGSKGDWRVEPRAELDRLEYVSILLYGPSLVPSGLTPKQNGAGRIVPPDVAGANVAPGGRP
jgi:rod shape-determining protein MreC